MPPAPSPISGEPSVERGASGASAGTPPVPGAEGVRGGRVAGGAHGPEDLRALTAIVLDALADAAP
ncbi:aspartate aminotransferase family protein, partial [Streptomyces parvus]|nr:aspartate aminotransferase family protein [Streptomyces parvus]